MKPHLRRYKGVWHVYASRRHQIILDYFSDSGLGFVTIRLRWARILRHMDGKD